MTTAFASPYSFDTKLRFCTVTSKLQNRRRYFACVKSQNVHPRSLDHDNTIPLIPTHTSFETLENVNDFTTADTGGGGGGGGGGSRTNKRDNSGDESDDDLPSDLQEALALGIVTREAVVRYRKFVANPLFGWLMFIPAFRTRMLADASFFFKLMVQELIGNGTALASEIAVRGKALKDELEYVASDLIVGTVVEAAFVWLLAPTLSLPSSNGANVLSRYLSSLPANAFVANTSTNVYTLSMRCAAFIYAGVQYMAIGVVAGIVGTAITYGLIEGRKVLDNSYSPKRPLPDVLPNALAWGAFMAISSNTRFQIVEGLERAIAHFCGGAQKPAVNAGIVTLRFANNYWGGVQFVQFFRWIGLHAVEEEEDLQQQLELIGDVKML